MLITAHARSQNEKEENTGEDSKRRISLCFGNLQETPSECLKGVVGGGGPVWWEVVFLRTDGLTMHNRMT